MQIKTLCLAAPPQGADPTPMPQLARAALRGVPGLREVQALRVLRHIPTDSVRADQGHAGVVPQADDIALVIECAFDDAPAQAAACAGAAWSGFLQGLRPHGTLLFSLDTEANVPIAPVRQAVDGGFRRWMLLARKAPTQAQFRDGWFGRHASLVKQMPEVDGYLQHLVTARQDAQGRALDYPALAIDGVAEMCFADEAAMNRAYASDARLAVRDDGRDLLGRITTVLVQGEAWR